MANRAGSAPAAQTYWADDGWWQALIDQAVDPSDPILSNLKITLAHRELSLALREITGRACGANFHTWAVWGSKKAGQTIREQDVPLLSARGVYAGSALASGVALGAVGGSMRRRIATSVTAGAAAHISIQRAADRFLGSAASHIFGGNVTVLADIGRQSARFVSAFLDPRDRGNQRLTEFVQQLRPGPAADGGEELLRGAYQHYLAASLAPDEDRRDESMLCGNLFAILHEHRRLQPYIEASVPKPLRRFVTAHLLGFTVGAEALHVSHDVPALGGGSFPDTLRTIEDPDLERFLLSWDRTPDSLAGSGARDWTSLPDRMNFIVDLFRTRQLDPDLFRAPFSDSQEELIHAGRVPPGPL